MKRSNQFNRTTRDIVNAFLEVLSDKPFEKITVQDILDAAMINRSTFYQHFSDKYAVLNYLQNKYMDEFSQIITQLRAQTGQHFSQMDDIFSDYFRKNAQTFKILLPIRTGYVDFRQGFRDIFEQYLHQILPALEPMELQMLSAMTIEHFLYNIINESDSTSYTKSLYEACLNLTLALFALEEYPEARSDLEALIRKYHAPTH